MPPVVIDNPILNSPFKEPDPDRERKLFFCQIEALETAIYLSEVASHYGDAWIENELREENVAFSSGLPRLTTETVTGV